MDELLAIGEFAAQSGLSAKMLRSYASAGLLVPAAVDRWSGYRYYAQSQLREAQLILWLRHAGVQLREIARFLDNPSAEQLRRWEQALDLETESRRSALAEVRDQLAASLTAGMEPAVAALVTPLQWGSTSLVLPAGRSPASSSSRRYKPASPRQPASKRSFRLPGKLLTPSGSGSKPTGP